MKTLQNFMLALALVFCYANSFGQSDQTDSVSTQLGNELNKIFSTDVYMEVDTILFDTRQNNFYFSETNNAMIMTMVVPQSFAKAEEHFNKQTKKEGYKTLEKKKITHNGKNILYQKGVLKKDGQKAYMYLYAMEATAESTIFFTGMHMEGDEDRFFPAIERAALSARLAK